MNEEGALLKKELEENELKILQDRAYDEMDLEEETRKLQEREGDIEKLKQAYLLKISYIDDQNECRRDDNRMADELKRRFVVEMNLL